MDTIAHNNTPADPSTCWSQGVNGVIRANGVTGVIGIHILDSANNVIGVTGVNVFIQ